MSYKHGVSFFTGFLIGGTIGAALVLLLAPQSGEETRTQIRDKGIELKDKFETATDDLKTRLTKEARRLNKKSVSEENDVSTR